MVLIGFANGFASLCGLRVLLGVAESLYLPAALGLMGDHHKETSLARGMSTFIIGISIGAIAGGSISGLIATHLGWRAVFWILGAFGILLALVFHALLPEAAVARRKSPSGQKLTAAVMYLARTPSYYALAAKMMSAGVGLWILSGWLPYYLHEQYRMNLESAGFYGTFFPEFSGLVGLMAGAFLSDYHTIRHPRHRMLSQGIGYLAAAPFLLCFLGVASFTTIAVGLLFFGLFRGLGDANEQPMLCDVVPACFRSTAVGIMNMSACSRRRWCTLGRCFHATSGAQYRVCDHFCVFCSTRRRTYRGIFSVC
jgi:predicted MFS family arabinose efflux permease